MQISEVRIKLVEHSRDRLLAFCSITFDEAFVVRDLKIIEGSRGPFVAMPSRKLMDRCRFCGGKNALRAPYCNQCGARLRDDRAAKSNDGRAKLYADIAHPINTECREMIQNAVLKAFEEEKIAAQQPGYVCRYDDFGENDPTVEEYGDLDFEADRSVPVPGDTASPEEKEETSPAEAGSHQRVEAPSGQTPPAPHTEEARCKGEPASVSDAEEEPEEDENSFGAGII